jgi:hypothetical protein
MHLPTAVSIIAASIMTIAAPALAQVSSPSRAYTASYKPARGVYCIRFFSDALKEPRPNVPAPDCMTAARWAKRGVFIQHRQPR